MATPPVWAIPQLYQEIKRHRTTLIFTSTRFLAEYLFELLWDANDDTLPIGIHHGSLSNEARRKVEGAMAAASCARWSAPPASISASTGATSTSSCRWARAKGSSRLLQRIGRANHRLDQPSKAILVPGNRFEFLENWAAVDAVDEGPPRR